MTTPSTTYRGEVEALMVAIPRIITRGVAAPGWSELENILTPETLPRKLSSALKFCAFSNSVPLATEIEPVTSDLRIVP